MISTPKTNFIGILHVCCFGHVGVAADWQTRSNPWFGDEFSVRGGDGETAQQTRPARPPRYYRPSNSPAYGIKMLWSQSNGIILPAGRNRNRATPGGRDGAADAAARHAFSPARPCLPYVACTGLMQTAGQPRPLGGRGTQRRLQPSIASDRNIGFARVSRPLDLPSDISVLAS